MTCTSTPTTSGFSIGLKLSKEIKMWRLARGESGKEKVEKRGSYKRLRREEEEL